jgi:hypothetical protein
MPDSGNGFTCACATVVSIFVSGGAVCIPDHTYQVCMDDTRAWQVQTMYVHVLGDRPVWIIRCEVYDDLLIVFVL